MRTILKSATVLALLVVCIAMAAPAVAGDTGSGGMRYSITVSKFENRAGWSGQWDLGDAWGTVMTDLLNQTGRFIVLGEKDMRSEALEEQDFAASGRTAGGSKAPATGQMTPAQLLVKGAITHVQEDTSGGGGGIAIHRIRIGGKKSKSEINATIYIVDSTTGQVLASTNVVGTSKSRGGSLGYSGVGWGGDVGGFKNDNTGKAVESAVSQAVDWLVQQLPSIPWTGSVVMVKDGKVYINRGSREGVAPGQTFVVGEETVIRDPDTGEVLDRSVTEKARLQAATVKEKLSICDVVSGNANTIAKGMAIQLP